MNRRNFLFFLSSLLTSLGVKKAKSLNQLKPNIILAIADDWSWPDASILGNTVIKTPNFDRIAQEGVLFTHTFISTPSCTASRSSLLTGQWPWRLKEAANLLGPLRPELEVFPDLLEKAGYYIGFAGKGCGPANPLGLGRQREPAGIKFQDFGEFLDKKPEDKPFYFWFGSHNPHRPYTWEVGVKSGMNIDDVVVPTFLPDSEIVRKDLCDYYWEVQQFDHELGELLQILKDKDELDSTLIIVTSDNGKPFPRAKHNLYDAGTRVPMSMRWGNQIEGGQVIDRLISLSDIAPSLLELVGIEIPEAMTGRSFFKLSPKELKISSTRDKIFFGRERDNLAQEDRQSGYPMRGIRTQNYLYIRNLKPERWPAGFPLVPAKSNEQAGFYLDIDPAPTKDYMRENSQAPTVFKFFVLAFTQRPAEELYNIKQDPEQLNNLANDPNYAQVKQQLAEQLIAELERTNDPRMGEDGDVFDKYPFRY